MDYRVQNARPRESRFLPSRVGRKVFAVNTILGKEIELIANEFE
ncbi:hypothetical protein PORCAN_1645 [Porphyromonas crevioricanis JCM 13913]|nr:hypothetical protein PORCAN_1645 [Porphyromonas crevioricanis JCM 13913]